jgi:DNA modification methylase
MRGEVMEISVKITDIKIGERIRKDLGNIEELAQSINEIGLINPVVISENNELIAGFRRLQALKMMGRDVVECRIMPLDSKTEIDENNVRKEFTVSERVQAALVLEERERQLARERQGVRTDLITGAKRDTQEKRDPVRTSDIVAQKTGFGSGRTYEKARIVIEKGNPELVEKLDRGDISIHSAYIAVKKNEEVLERKKEAEDLSIPSGICCGAAEDELDKLLEDGTCDCLITDPPFGDEFVSNFREYENDITVPVENDTRDAAVELLYRVLVVMDRKLKANSHAYIFSSWKSYPHFKPIIERFFTIKNVIVWDKGGVSLGDIYNNYGETYELIIFATKGERSLLGERIPNIIKMSKVSEPERDHPMQKPIDLLKIFIEKSTVEGEMIVDPFAGTGSLLFAAKETGRKYTVIEKNPDFVRKMVYKLKNNSK